MLLLCWFASFLFVMGNSSGKDHDKVGCVFNCYSYSNWWLFILYNREYADSDKTERFTDSQFLVFVNRILAFLFSGIYLLLTHQNIHRTPLYKYSFCSVSNTLSSWCQYEALKFVSFPTQVLQSCSIYWLNAFKGPYPGSIWQSFRF
jgi:hypothetical protein